MRKSDAARHLLFRGVGVGGTPVSGDALIRKCVHQYLIPLQCRCILFAACFSSRLVSLSGAHQQETGATGVGFHQTAYNTPAAVVIAALDSPITQRSPPTRKSF